MTDEQTSEATPEARADAADAAGATEPGAEGEGHASASDAESWGAQLQRMIDDIGRQALPVIREVAAKAAELAAVAGEKAGPFAQKAAEKTAELGAAVAARGHEMATELRRADEGEASTTEETTAAAEPPSSSEQAAEATGDESNGA
jgi:hypothetical protein